jgi:HTH-type transcriptional regulator / antitoxin HipB
MYETDFDMFNHVRVSVTCKNVSDDGVYMRSHIKPDRLPALPSDLIRALLKARQAHHWSQRDLASRVGLPQQHISAIERGKVVPRFNTLLDLVRILGFDLLLIPRPLIPAVQSLIRDAEHPDSSATGEDERPLYASEEGEDTIES